MGSFAASANTSFLLGSNTPVPSGTANGVLYLNGSKVVTSGSALTFQDVQNSGLGVSGSGSRVITARSTDTSGAAIGYVSAEFGGGASLQMRAGLGYTFLMSSGAADPLLIGTGGFERMRIDSSGNGALGTTNTTGRKFAVFNDRAVNAYSQVWTTNNGASFENDVLLRFDGTSTAFGNFQSFPLLFLTNAQERFRITSGGNQIATQPAESAQNASVTLTVANLQAGIITSNAAVTLTLPTGASLETYSPFMVADTAFECVFIATTANAITLAANGNTTVGSLTVAGNTSGTFRFRKTAANTFTVYRVA